MFATVISYNEFRSNNISPWIFPKVIWTKCFFAKFSRENTKWFQKTLWNVDYFPKFIGKFTEKITISWLAYLERVELLLLPVQAGPGRQLAGQLVYAEGCRILSQQRVPAELNLHTKRGREERGMCVGVNAKQIILVKEDNSELIMHIYRVADPDPGSSALLTPGSGIWDGYKIRIRIWDVQPGSYY